jgi:cytochrome b
MPKNMPKTSNAHTPPATTPLKVRVWDLPLRIFHWSLLLTITGLFVSAKLAETDIGAAALQWHFCFGYIALTLLLFRVVWGFAGSRYAKFSSFPPNPLAAWHMFKSIVNKTVVNKSELTKTLGHNPMGALSVYALLAALAFQAISGLFCNDDMDSYAPLAHTVSKQTSDLITYCHKFNETIIIVLIVLHLAAIAFYHFKKREPLIAAMITGDKPHNESAIANTAPLAASDTAVVRLKALAILLLCAASVAVVVSWGGGGL